MSTSTNRITRSSVFLAVLLLALLATGCSNSAVTDAGGNGGNGGQQPAAFNVTYNANGADSGRVPVDTGTYITGAGATVCNNTGNLTKAGYEFEGWNTAADGSGSLLMPQEHFAVTEHTTLYAMWGTFDVWDGTTKTPIIPADGVYNVRSAAELAWLAAHVNEGKPLSGYTIRLLKSIDLDNKPFEGIAVGNEGDNRILAANFDGTGKKIKNLNIYKPQTDYVGFIGRFNAGWEGGFAKNLTIESGNVTGRGEHHDWATNPSTDRGKGVGGIVAVAESKITITNCHNKAAVTATDGGSLGGILGLSDYSTEIINCSNTGAITADNTTLTASMYGVGGIAGRIMKGNSKVSQCYNTGNVTNNAQGSSGSDFDTSVGGIIGQMGTGLYQSGTIIIEKSWNSGSVSAPYRHGAAGIVSLFLDSHSNESGIFQCYNSGMVKTSANKSVGGFVNFIGNRIENCYNSGTLEGELCYGIGSGLRGWGQAVNCYNTGTFNILTADPSRIQHTKSIWGQGGVGGGWNQEKVCVNTYYLIQTSPITFAGTEFPDFEDNCTGLSSLTSFANQSNFAGWDFTNVWIIKTDGNGVTRPMLRGVGEGA